MKQHKVDPEAEEDPPSEALREKAALSRDTGRPPRASTLVLLWGEAEKGEEGVRALP